MMTAESFINALHAQIDTQQPSAESLAYLSAITRGDVTTPEEYDEWLAKQTNPNDYLEWFARVHAFEAKARRAKLGKVMNLVSGPSTDADLNCRSHVDLVATVPFSDGSPAQVRQQGSLYAIADGNGVCFQDVAPWKPADSWKLRYHDQLNTEFYSLELKFENAAEARKFLTALPAGFRLDDVRIAGQKCK